MSWNCWFSKNLDFSIQNGALNLLNVSCPFVILCQTVRPFFSRGPVAAETASRRSCWWLRLSWSTASSLRRRWQSGKSNCIGSHCLICPEIWPFLPVLRIPDPVQFKIEDLQNRSPWRWPWKRTRSSAGSRWASTSILKGATVSVYSILILILLDWDLQLGTISNLDTSQPN